jgi:hypothetical protein
MAVRNLCRTVLPGVGGSQVNLGVQRPAVADGQEWLTNHTLGNPNPACALGLSPLGITTILTKLLTTHFSDPDTIMSPSLKQYVWSQDPQVSKLRITQATRFDPRSTGQFPALVIKRGNQVSERKVLGDQGDSEDPRWAETGEVPYLRFMQGEHQVFAVAEVDGEAEDLGIEVFEALTYLSPQILGAYMFMNFEVVGLSELGLLEEMGNKVGTSVSIRYAYELAWTLAPLAPPVKTLSIDTTT